MNGMGDWIRYNANWAGARIALDLGEESYTYLEMQRAVDLRCDLLVNGLGMRAGEHLAYLGHNSCDVFVVTVCLRTHGLCVYAAEQPPGTAGTSVDTGS